MVFQNYALIDSDRRRQYRVSLPEHTDETKGYPRISGGFIGNAGAKPRHRALPDSLSGGEKAGALARAVITNPEVVLFDEPTTGLDPIMIEFVDELIQRTQVEYGPTSAIIPRYGLQSAACRPHGHTVRREDCRGSDLRRDLSACAISAGVHG